MPAEFWNFKKQQWEPFMNEDTVRSIPSVGDNLPPIEFALPSVDEIVAMLEVNYADVLARTEEIVSKAEPYYQIQTDEEDEAATEFLNSVRANWKTGEAGRVKEKDLYDQRAGAVHGWFRTHILDRVGAEPAKPNEPFDPVERTDLGVGPRIRRAQTLFKSAKLEAERKVRAEAERIAREAEDKARRERLAAEAAALEAQRSASRKRNEEQREKAQALLVEAQRVAEAAHLAADKAAEERAAAEAAANVKAADLTRARGGRGGVSSLREFLAARDISRSELGRMPDQKAEPPGIVALLPYIADKDLEKAANAYAKANGATIRAHLEKKTQPVRGITFFVDHSTSGRS